MDRADSQLLMPAVEKPESGLRLGFVSARSAYVDAAGVWVDAGVGRLLDIWARDCRQLTVGMSQEPEQMPLHHHRLEMSPDRFRPMPFLPSVARGFHKASGCREAIRQVEKESDVVIVQLPFAAPTALLGAQKPRVYHLCHHIWAVAKTSPLYAGWRRPPALLVGGAIDFIQRRLVRAPNTRVVANGGDLFRHYGNPPGCEVVSGSLLEREIMSAKRQRPADAPFRVLYVGYLRHEKGIDVLLDAFERLLVDIPDAELVMVGTRNSVDYGMSALLDESLARLKSKSTVRLIEHLKFGPELFQCFADADVLALPSRAEGTPRVLIEARAFGCTAVGTRVGGIPSSIIDGVDGLIVEPEDAAGLKDALLRIARDPQLRAGLVTAGIERARQSSIEAFADKILAQALSLWQPTSAVGT